LVVDDPRSDPGVNQVVAGCSVGGGWAARFGIGHARPVSKQRFLVAHDYGMGGLWWWIHAGSARQVRETFAEVEVITDSRRLAIAAGWSLEEVDIDADVMPPGLDGLRAQRDGQRDQPGFGALADRHVVYLRRRWDEDDPAFHLMEIGADGRRMRQVEIPDSGPAIKTDERDWPFNPPVDLYDPALPELEIGRDAFERAWLAAEWDADHGR
jgi:hypothetical protein